MKRKSKKYDKIHVDDPKNRSGHYDYQSKSKSIFNSQPRRQRTRQKQLEIEMEGYDEYEK